MLRSMTGYGRVSRSMRDKTIFMELKSVNSRYLDLAFRLPQRWDRYEIEFAGIIRKRIHRGKISIAAGITGARDRGLRYINRAQVRLYRRERRLFTPGYAPIRNHDDFSLDDVTGGFAIDPELISDEIHMMLHEALDSLVKSRTDEGTAMETEFMTHVESLDDLMGSIELRMEDMPDILADRMDESLKRIGPDAVPLKEDRERIAKEVAAQLIKGDFTEEHTRMKSHIQSFKNTIQAEPPHGRHLEFILQEMQRELNTMTSKCSLVDSVHLVIQSRVLVEKMREQVANIE